MLICLMRCDLGPPEVISFFSFLAAVVEGHKTRLRKEPGLTSGSPFPRSLCLTPHCSDTAQPHRQRDAGLDAPLGPGPRCATQRPSGSRHPLQ